MNVVDLKNIVLLVTKKIWSSVNLECKIMSQVRKIMLKQIVSVVQLEVFVLSVPIWTLHTCGHCVPMTFPQSTQRGTLYYFRRIELNWIEITLFKVSYVILKLHNSSHLLRVCLTNANWPIIIMTIISNIKQRKTLKGKFEQNQRKSL